MTAAYFLMWLAKFIFSDASGVAVSENDVQIGDILCIVSYQDILQAVASSVAMAWRVSVF